MIKRPPVYIAVVAISLDGKIATATYQKNWSSPEDQNHLHKVEDSCDVLVMGRNSYEVAKEKLMKRNVMVFSRSSKKENKHLVFVNPEKTKINEYLQQKKYKRICILGGPEVYSYFLERNLIDELWVTIEPIVFGQGLGIFSKLKESKQFRLLSIKKLNNKGSVLLHYVK